MDHIGIVLEGLDRSSKGLANVLTFRKATKEQKRGNYRAL